MGTCAIMKEYTHIVSRSLDTTPHYCVGAEKKSDVSRTCAIMRGGSYIVA